MKVKRTATAVVLAAWGLLCVLGAGAYPAGAYPTGAAAGVSVSASCVDQGGTLNVFGVNFAPNAQVRLSLESVNLGFAQANADGALSTAVTVPSDVSTGQHTLRADSDTDSASATVQVGCGGAPAAGSGSGGGLSQTGVAVVGISALGIVLLTGGLLMVFVGRRRTAG